MNKLLTFLQAIKFEYTVFALPFAWLGYVLGARGVMDWRDVFWVTVVMVAARTAGMALNRLADAKFDAQNPRTSQWALVTGALSRRFVKTAIAVSLLVMLVATWMLDPICLRWLPVAMLFLVVYHYLKRFTWLCHFGIGLVLSFAPMGGWIAATGYWEVETVVLGASILLWVSGFDLIYSVQDAQVDRKLRLHSIPARFGETAAMHVALIAHALMIFGLLFVGRSLDMGALYWMGWGLAVILIALQHALARIDFQKYVNAAFFMANGVLSIAFCVLAIWDQVKA